MEMVLARRKPGTPTCFVYFDPEKQEALGPALGLEKAGREWWYHDDRSHFSIPVGHMVPLNDEGKACGFAGGPDRFWKEYEAVEEA